MYSPYDKSIEIGEVVTNLANDTDRAISTLNAAALLIDSEFPLMREALETIGTDKALSYLEYLQQAMRRVKGSVSREIGEVEA